MPNRGSRPDARTVSPEPPDETAGSIQNRTSGVAGARVRLLQSGPLRVAPMSAGWLLDRARARAAPALAARLPGGRSPAPATVRIPSFPPSSPCRGRPRPLVRPVNSDPRQIMYMTTNGNARAEAAGAAGARVAHGGAWRWERNEPAQVGGTNLHRLVDGRPRGSRARYPQVFRRMLPRLGAAKHVHRLRTAESGLQVVHHSV